MIFHVIGKIRGLRLHHQLQNQISPLDLAKQKALHLLRLAGHAQHNRKESSGN